MGKGTNPAPPELSETVHKWTPAELFWIVKYGLKMTGMPAWGPTHRDDELWAITAFLLRLPELSPEEYRSMTKAGDATSDGRMVALAGPVQNSEIGRAHVGTPVTKAQLGCRLMHEKN